MNKVARNLMVKRQKDLDPKSEALIARLGQHAGNLFLTRQLLCTEAVMVALNRGLNGGLSDDQAIAMAAPFCVAMGESGCMCGALSGAIMAAGLFLGSEQPYRHRRSLRGNARRLHDNFQDANGTTCCRVLCRKVKQDKNAHFKQCAELTAEATESAARLILEKRPELIAQAHDGCLAKQHSKIGAPFRRLWRYFSN